MSDTLLKKAHLLRCAQSPRSNVLPEYASARRFLARLAPGTFLTSLQTEYFNSLMNAQDACFWIAVIVLFVCLAQLAAGASRELLIEGQRKRVN